MSAEAKQFWLIVYAAAIAAGTLNGKAWQEADKGVENAIKRGALS
jgi:hypothetical protein